MVLVGDKGTKFGTKFQIFGEKDAGTCCILRNQVAEIAIQILVICLSFSTFYYLYHFVEVNKMVIKKIVNIGVRMTDIPFYLSIGNGKIYHIGYNSDNNH